MILITTVYYFDYNYKPKTNEIDLSNLNNKVKKDCYSEKVSCTNTEDCKKDCLENLETVCNNKICGPPHPTDIPCNHANGGVFSWTGWKETENMRWECECMYPEIAGGAGCELNPNVCKGGTWTYNATNNPSYPPDHHYCNCSDNQQLIETADGIPFVSIKHFVLTKKIVFTKILML